MSRNHREYSDDNWVVDIYDDKIYISFFKDFHYVDDIEFTQQMFSDGLMDKIRDLQNGVD